MVHDDAKKKKLKWSKQATWYKEERGDGEENIVVVQSASSSSYVRAVVEYYRYIQACGVRQGQKF